MLMHSKHNQTQWLKTFKKVAWSRSGSDGAISVKGEEVKPLLSMGRDFFGKGIQNCTKNLPADAVKRCKYLRKKSKTSKFTGINDGQDEMTINLELKRRRKNGILAISWVVMVLTINMNQKP